MTNIWIGQRVIANRKTGTIRDAYYQSDLFDVEDDVLMLAILPDGSTEVIMMPVDSVTLVGLEGGESG